MAAKHGFDFLTRQLAVAILVKYRKGTFKIFLRQKLSFVERSSQKLRKIDITAAIGVHWAHYADYVWLLHIKVGTYFSHMFLNFTLREDTILVGVPLNECGTSFSQVFSDRVHVGDDRTHGRLKCGCFGELKQIFTDGHLLFLLKQLGLFIVEHPIEFQKFSYCGSLFGIFI